MFDFLSYVDHVTLAKALGIVIVGAPALLVLLLGLPSLLGHPFRERMTDRCVQISIVIGLLASLSMLVLMLFQGTHHLSVDLGTWVEIPHYHFSIKLIFDRLSVPFVILTFVLCGTISAF